MSLKTTLTTLYIQALQTGQPQETTLKGGLGVKITVQQGKCTLQLIRFWAAYPSEVEVRTVLRDWPYPITTHSETRKIDGRRRIIEIPIPVQEVLPS